ncbi:MAG: GNAT family N-acetyltransferase [Flavobacteriales bacterium]
MLTQTILENNRVLLRPLQATDFDYLLPYSLHEPENWQFGLENAAGEENLRKYIDQALEGRQNGQAIPFIIFDKQSNTYAGSTRYYQINLKHRRLAVGYSWLGNDFKRTGLNANVKYLMLEYAFESLKMERVEFMADALNERSIHSILSLGATFEGIHRSHAEKPDGNRRDTAVFSILKKEWLELVKPSLFQKISR